MQEFSRQGDVRRATVAITLRRLHMNAPTTPDESGLLQKAERINEILRGLEAVLPQHSLLHSREDTTPYECDGLTAYRQRPLAVALPETTDQVQAVLRACHAMGVPVVARGAGTGLSGGAMPHRDGVTLSLARFNRILAMDAYSRTAVVQWPSASICGYILSSSSSPAIGRSSRPG